MPIKNYTTKVDVYSTMGEIQGALAKAGATQIMVNYDCGKPTGIAFALISNINNNKSCFMLPSPIEGTLRVFKKQKLKTDQEQAERTAWRNVRDWVLSQLALIEACDIPADEVFLPYLVNNKGETLYQVYSSGQLMIEPPKGF